jgi:hypothetical protein
MNNEFKYINLDGRYIFKIIGKATMKNSKILSDYIESIFKDIKTLSFEMSELEYMDSTFLGLVAKFVVDLKTQKSQKFIILNPSKEAYTLLKQTGIDKFCDVINEDIDFLNIKKVEGEDLSNMKEKSKYILEMHETLMNLNEENRIAFQPVVDAMKKVID